MTPEEELRLLQDFLVIIDQAFSSDKSLQKAFKSELEKDIKKTSAKTKKTNKDKYKLLELNIQLHLINGDQRPYMNTEIADKTGLSKQTVSDIKNEALRKLRRSKLFKPGGELWQLFQKHDNGEGTEDN